MEALDPQVCRNARLSRDPRFDGQFFLAVTSTGIYCRPICPARAPRERNVDYYRTAAEAAHHGFRPCLRCRPESAPNSPAWRGTSTTIHRALALINAGALNEQSLPEFSARLGVGERYLRKLFDQHLGVSPAAVARTQRLHFAQKLLAETDMAISDIAFAAGYGSLRRFNSAMREAFACSPRELREKRRKTAVDSIELELKYRPPLDWQSLLDFFQRHSIQGLEGVEGQSYWRNIQIDDCKGRLEVRHHPRRDALQLKLSHLGTEHLMPIVANVRRMFDLDATPTDISETLAQSPLFCQLDERFPGTRAPGHWSLFECCVRGVVGQQISVAAARGVQAKLLMFCADEGEEDPGFPTPQQLLALPDEQLPMPNSRKQTLRSVCEVFANTEEPDDVDVSQLEELKGIGPWTVAMIKMRGSGDPDVFPRKDLGLVQGAAKLGFTEKEMEAQAQACQPWRSYTANLLWRSLS